MRQCIRNVQPRCLLETVAKLQYVSTLTGFRDAALLCATLEYLWNGENLAVAVLGTGTYSTIGCGLGTVLFGSLGSQGYFQAHVWIFLAALHHWGFCAGSQGFFICSSSRLGGDPFGREDDPFSLQLLKLQQRPWFSWCASLSGVILVSDPPKQPRRFSHISVGLGQCLGLL